MMRGGPKLGWVPPRVLLAAFLGAALVACGRSDLEVSSPLPIVDAAVPDVHDSAPQVDTSRPLAPCVPGEQVACTCVGGGLGVKDCVADGGGFGTCHGCPDFDAAPPPKDAGSDVACTPGTLDCVGATPEICAEAGQWMLEASCGDGVPFCLEGQCVACSPGTTTCGAAEGGSGSGTVEVCSAAGEWQPTTTCSQPRPDCSEGACTCLETACASGCVSLKTDSANCGVCGHDCLGGTCAEGFCQPITLVSGLGEPWALRSDGAFVYWVDRTLGNVAKVPVTGGATTILASGGSSPDGIAIDASNVYWVDSNAGTVSKVPLAGGTVTTLATDRRSPVALAIDASNVYWLDEADLVQSVPIAGGLTTSLASSPLPPSGIAADGINVYWTVQATAAGGAVLSIPRAGGAITTLATEPTLFPTGITVGGGTVFWTSQDLAFELPLNSTINSVASTGGAPLVLVSGESDIGTIAYDGLSAFWVNNDFGSASPDNSVTRLALGTTTPLAVALDQTFITGVAVDSLRAYWSALGDNPPQTGTILAVAK